MGRAPSRKSSKAQASLPPGLLYNHEPAKTINPTETCTTLLTLPDELLIEIVSHLDPPTGIALRRASARFLPLTEEHPWRHLHLSVDDDPGRAAKLEGPTPPSAPAKVEKALRGRLERKLSAILAQADEKKWAMVQSVTMVPRPGTILGIIEILRHVSRSVRAIHIAAPCHPSAGIPGSLDTIDTHLYSSHLTLSELRHLCIEKITTQCHKFIPYLQNFAPNLETLEINEFREPFHAIGMLPSPHLPVAPHLVVRNYHLTHFLAQKWMSELDGILPYIDLFPNLKRMHLTFPSLLDASDSARPLDEPERQGIRAILRKIGRLGCLEDLIIPIEMDEFSKCLDRTAAGFPVLRRLVLGSSTMDFQTERLPLLPKLEAIYMAASLYTPPPTFDHVSYPHIPSAKVIRSTLAADLRATPHLRTIHILTTDLQLQGLGVFDALDRIDAAQSENGIITSVRHGDNELLHIRLLENQTSVGATWSHFTDFRGKVVPLEIVEKMRAEAGCQEEDWKRRGIEVGEAAWGILERWYAGQGVAGKPKEKKGKAKKGKEKQCKS